MIHNTGKHIRDDFLQANKKENGHENSPNGVDYSLHKKNDKNPIRRLVQAVILMHL